MLGMDGECNHLAETVFDPVFSDTLLAPVLLGRG